MIKTVLLFQKSTKNFQVYGSDPMDAKAPILNSVYFDKQAVPGDPANPPRALQVTIEEVR